MTCVIMCGSNFLKPSFGNNNKKINNIIKKTIIIKIIKKLLKTILK